MGKSLIIKGADFSANAIEGTGIVWDYQGFTENYGTATEYGPGGTVNGAWTIKAINEALRGKTVSVVRCVPKAAGVFNFYKVSTSPDNLTTLPAVVAYITIPSASINQETNFELSTPITLASNEYLIFGENGLPHGGDVLWLSLGTGTNGDIIFKIGTAEPQTGPSKFAMFDFGHHK